MSLRAAPDGNWLNAPLIIMGHVVDLWNLPKDVRSIVREKRALGFNAEHWLSADFKAGPCDGKFLFRTSVGTLRDDLGGYLPLAHKAALRVFVYFNAHWYSDALPDEMFIRDAKGQKAAAYGHGWLTCPTGPFLAWSEQVAHDLGEYDIDGVFIDGPCASACWCPACRKAFEARCGIPMPDDPAKVPVEVRLKLAEFNGTRRRDYVDAFRRAVTHRKKDIAVYFNGDTLSRPMRGMRIASESMDLIGAEGGFIGYQPLRGQFRYKTGATAKMLEAIDPDKPRVVFIDHGFKRYDYYPLTPSEVRLMYAGTIAHGAWPWFLVYWFNRRGPAGRAGSEMNRFISEHAGLLAKTASLADVALVCSDATLEVLHVGEPDASDDLHATGVAHAKEPLGDHHAEMLGLYEALSRSQAPFDLLDDGSLAAGVPERYRLLILPNCAAMSDAVASGIRRFVSQGGAVIATGDTSLRDEAGYRRESLALADVFGVRSLGAAWGPSTLDYVFLEPRRLLARGIEAAAIPCPVQSRYVTPTAGAKVLARYYGRMPGRYVKLPDVRPDAFAVLNRFGRGRAAYFAGNLGEHYHAYCFDDHRRMIVNVLRAFVKPAVEVDGAGEHLEVAWRRSAHGEYLLHLLNHAGGERPYAGVLPLDGLAFRVRVPEKVKSVRAAKSGRRIPFRRKSGEVAFAFDMKGEYEMIVIAV